MGTRGLLTCDIDDIFPKHEQIQKNQQITKYDNPLNKTEAIVEIQKKIKENA